MHRIYGSASHDVDIELSAFMFDFTLCPSKKKDQSCVPIWLYGSSICLNEDWKYCYVYLFVNFYSEYSFVLQFISASLTLQF